MEYVWDLPQNAFAEECENFFMSQKLDLEHRVEYALRHLVTPPIKGEITRGKLKWRGIKLWMIKDDKEGIVLDGCVNPDGVSLISAGRPIQEKGVRVNFAITYYLLQRLGIIPLNFTGEEKERYEQWLKLKEHEKSTNKRASVRCSARKQERTEGCQCSWD